MIDEIKISAQKSGWKEPIDNLNLGLGLKNSFPEAMGHKPIFRQSTPKKDKK